MNNDKTDDSAPNVTLNERTMTRDQFEREKETLEKKPGVSVVEVGDNAYRSRIKG